jgi:uncharacterized membrane protein YczE
MQRGGHQQPWVPDERRIQRLVQLVAGLVLFGVSIAVMLQAGLGVDSWDVLHQGIAQRTGVGFGWVVVGVSGAVLILWVPLGVRPGIGTVLNALVVGIVADFTLRHVGSPEVLPAQLAFLVTGVVANSAATGLYIGAGLGPGPRDGLMTGLSARTGWSIRTVRTGIEIVVLATGWALGGPVGVGTLLYAVSIGPLTQFFLTWFSLDRVAEAPVARRRAAEACP